MGLIKSLENVDMFCQLFSFFFSIYTKEELYSKNLVTL